ncbi:MAG: hypothetical protein HCA25_01235 [Dolichospermum sp. DET50]|nr:hypothetical protein [Dolichospermum sp. DET66]MBS3030939.1 hypothetical protein [Dolichospermum sp. DET67]MBS3036149.1 hypothetical protein [Dolichospermum sp. DET50]QSX68224.1 MAG: hypothetical protein EZY12_00405 [Dolichospermum sp. DET69]
MATPRRLSLSDQSGRRKKKEEENYQLPITNYQFPVPCSQLVSYKL